MEVTVHRSTYITVPRKRDAQESCKLQGQSEQTQEPGASCRKLTGLSKPQKEETLMLIRELQTLQLNLEAYSVIFGSPQLLQQSISRRNTIQKQKQTKRQQKKYSAKGDKVQCDEGQRTTVQSSCSIIFPEQRPRDFKMRHQKDPQGEEASRFWIKF